MHMNISESIDDMNPFTAVSALVEQLMILIS